MRGEVNCSLVSILLECGIHVMKTGTALLGSLDFPVILQGNFIMYFIP